MQAAYRFSGSTWNWQSVQQEMSADYLGWKFLLNWLLDPQRLKRGLAMLLIAAVSLSSLAQFQTSGQTYLLLACLLIALISGGVAGWLLRGTRVNDFSIRSLLALRLVCLSVVVFGGAVAMGQVSPDLDQGMKPYGSYHGGDLDHISMSNGNVFFLADLLAYAQRGELPYRIVLQYNNENFSIYQQSCPPGVKNPPCPIRYIFGPPWVTNGVSLGNSVIIGPEAPPRIIPNGPKINTGYSLNGQPIYVQLYAVLTSDGSMHPLANTDSGAFTLDGSDFANNNSVGVLLDRHGNKFNGTIAEDPNGNQINYSTGADTLNRQIPPMPGPNGNYAATPPASTGSLSACPALGYANQTAAYAYLWNLPTTNGGTLPLTLCYTSVYVNSGADSSSIYQVHQSFFMLQSVVFPDNTYWAFQYDAGDPNNSSLAAFGDLLKVTLPTGGSVSYTWAWCSCSTPGARSVVTRSVDANDGNGPRTWHYSYGGQPTVVNGISSANTTVTDPLGNDTVHTMTGLGGFETTYETQVKYFQGSQSSGTLLKTVQTDYQYTNNVYDSSYVSANGVDSVTNVFPMRFTIVLPNGLVSKTETDYDTALAYHGPLDGITSNVYNCDPDGVCQYQAQTTEPVTNYTGSYGKVIATRQYDWGQGAAGPLLGQTASNYLWQSNSNYLTYNFLDLVSSTIVKDGSGNQVAQTTNGYDEYLLNSSGITTQHNANPVNGNVRGNQTSVHRWLNGTTTSTPNCAIAINNGFLVSFVQYNDTGTVNQSTDSCGSAPGDMNHRTTHSYDSAYAGAYPTKTCDPLGHCVNATYDFNTALLSSFIDANNQITNYSYDNHWRMTQVLFPVADSSGVRPETDFAYPNLTTVQRKKRQDANNWITDYAYFDGLGRTKQTQLVDPEGDDFVDMTYDALGRISTVSNPHRSSSSSTDGITTNYYDALGRVVQIAPPDGTLLPSGIATTQCQANNVCTDYSNFPTMTVTDQAGRVRRSRSDALGRLVEVDEPGPGANGPGTSGSGSISVSGSLYSSSTSGKAGTGSVTVSGSIQKMYVWVCNDTCIRQLKTDPGGTVSITVNGHVDSVTYNGASTANSIATQLVSQINGDGGAFVSASGPTCADSTDCTLSLTARTNGPNYSLSAQGQSTDETDGFSSFDSTSASGTALTGGSYPSTTYDSGTLTVTAGSFQASASYSQSQNSSSSAMAQAITNALNASGSPVTASVSGATISMTAKTVGTATNYTVTGSSTRSFTASSTTLSGGTNPGGLASPYVTGYTYDTLGNLVQVNQAGDGSQAARVRTFTYDSLSRLLTATNPETGKITYQYDANGNTLQKISPAPNQLQSTVTQTISYCYDVLNRPTGRAYSAQSCPLSSPVVTYTYDAGTNGIGHLTTFTDQAGTGSYTYDPRGRIATELRTIAGVSKSLSYSYNLDSSLKSLTYPSGAVIQYQYSTAGDPGAVQDTINNINYVMGTNGPPNLALHAPDGSLTSYVNGYSATFGGITSNINYNKRLQPVTMAANFGSPAQSVFSLTYDFHLANGNNGNVWDVTNNRDTSRNQVFNYDQLNRLISAQNAGTDCTKKTVNNLTEYWGDNYGYDAWGNLTQKTVTKCSAENLNAAASSINQLHTTSGTDYAYDAAGNMTHDATSGANLNYDAENRITAAGGYAYTYDDDGNRVEKSNGTTGTLYWYMSPGIVAESDLNGNLKSEYVFFSGKRLARKDFPGSAVSYYFSDHLKTASVITDSAGNIKEDEDFYPWGGELQFVNNDSNHFKFGGHERDAESGLDYFGARYYGNWIGRFLTPDWAGKATAVPYADFSNPQTLNLYAYVGGNPSSKADINGHCIWDACAVEFWLGAVIVTSVLATPPAQNAVREGVKGIGNAVDWAGDKALQGIHAIANKTSTSQHSTPAVPPPPPPPGQQQKNQSTKNKSEPGHTTRSQGSGNNGQGTKVIGKTFDLNKEGALRPGEQKLDLPNQGNPKANWIQNSSKLREAMAEGNPIRDASVNDDGSLRDNTGFLRAERNELSNKGWTYDGGTTTWNPPQK
jgi:RHS repeat-associated protein